MELTNTAIQNAKPGEKSYRLYDGRGLYLEVAPCGGKWWRFKYRFEGKEKRISLGVYPDVTLKNARERHGELRTQLANGIDPGENRKAMKAARKESLNNSFEVVALEWFAKYSKQWTELYASRLLERLKKDVFPFIGGVPIADLKPIQILSMLRRIEGRGALEVTHRALQYCGQVLRYAVATGRSNYDFSRDLKGALQPLQPGHHAAITEPSKVGALLRAVDEYEGYFVVKCALRLLPLVFVRPGELRGAEWKEIDLEKGEWSIPAERMKMAEPHFVSLSRQAVAILKEVQAVTGGGRYVFPSARSIARILSNNAFNAALRRMGFTKDEMTAHGFRAMARTLLDEELNFRPDIIEHQLAHAVKDPNGRAYNRTSHLPERIRMMQEWADYLDALKGSAKIIPFGDGAAQLRYF